MNTEQDKVWAKSQPHTASFATLVGNTFFVLCVCLLCGWVLSYAVNASRQCLWPAEWDTLRDISMAQTILDGHYPDDPILSGETLWYNPLTGIIIAVAGHISGVPLNEASIALGPYVNLLAPLGLAFLLWCFFGRSAALAGLCMILFAKEPQTPFWVNACYSPWLLAPLYSLGLFCLTLVAYWYAVKKKRLRWYCVAGILLGITFMAHTAPALVVGGVIVLTTIIETGLLWFRKRKTTGTEYDSTAAPWRIAFHVLVLLLVAFVISLPYTWSILWHYHFKVQNPYPSLFAADYVSLSNLPDRLRESLNWKNLVALAGTVALVRKSRKNMTARFVLCWIFVAIAFLIQHYLWQFLLTKNIVLTAFVPAHHAAIHLSAVRAVVFAVGIITLGQAIAILLLRLAPGNLSVTTQQVLRQGSIVILVILSGVILYRTHPLTSRADFIVPDRALYHEFHELGIPMYQWILENTTSDAVFLCDEESIGMTVVMPAGRKLVSAMLLYSNPYVPFGPLFETQKNLLEAIKNGDRETFCQLAKQYPVLYLLVKQKKSQENHKKYEKIFEDPHQAGNLVVWRAKACCKN